MSDMIKVWLAHTIRDIRDLVDLLGQTTYLASGLTCGTSAWDHPTVPTVKHCEPQGPRNMPILARQNEMHARTNESVVAALAVTLLVGITRDPTRAPTLIVTVATRASGICLFTDQRRYISRGPSVSRNNDDRKFSLPLDLYSLPPIFKRCVHAHGRKSRSS